MAGIIGLVAPGGPFIGGNGRDGPIVIPGYMISQEDSNKIKANLGFIVSIDLSNKVLSQADCDIDSGETVVILDVSKDPLNSSIECIDLGRLLT